MADKIKRMLSLYGIFAKMDLAWVLLDTKYAIAVIITDIISNLSILSGVFLISVRFNGIGGLNSSQILFMMAYSSITTGIFIMFNAENNLHISRVIGRGQMEHMFIQPLSFKTQLSTSGFCPVSGSGSFVTGIILLAVSLGKLHLHITFLWVLLLVISLATTMVITVVRSYLFASSAFYAPVACEEISMTVIEDTWQLSTFPLSGMPLLIQLPLVTILPEGLMAWFPSMVLLGKNPMFLPSGYPVIFAIFLSIITFFVFRKGFRYYVTKGSNRYVRWGFRG